MLRRFAALPLLLCGGLAGCGNPDCEELCEDSTDCPQSTTDDCAAECQQLENLARASGCQGDFDEFITCVGDAEDVCNAEECAAIGSDLLNCELAWCLDHSAHPTCPAVTAEACPVRAADACHESQACTETNAEGETVVLPDCTVGQTCADASYSLTCEVFGSECVCARAGEAQASVAYQPEFCEPKNLDQRVAAAKAACGWP